MSKSEKTRIDLLKEGQDYSIWKIRIDAACNAKRIGDALEYDNCPSFADEKKAQFLAAQKKASGIIVTPLSNEAFRVVRSDINSPCVMLQKLGERYNSKTAASRIAKMTELIALRYLNTKQGMGKHIDKMKGILEKLEAMNTKIPKELAIAILISSIDASELIPITAALKTLTDDSATWDTVSARLIEEQHSVKAEQKRLERVHTAKSYCHICNKSGHTTEKCWLNPNNPSNKLRANPREATHARNSVCGQKKARHEKKKDQKVRAALARVTTMTVEDRNRMKLDSGTNSHMTANQEYLKEVEDCHVPIALGDDFVAHATKCGVFNVEWNANGQRTKAGLSNTLGVHSLAMNLHSVPALTEKDFSLLFTEQKAVIFDEVEVYRPVAVAPKEPDGLYYTNTDENVFTNCDSEGIMRAQLMGTIESPTEEDQVSYNASESDSNISTTGF
ncbi:gag-polypeptide of LTR copia-type [Gracilaria domingensis]|nr:gag-polypeptide of LTR copia-type [Gracilaria domingensis]